MAKNKGNNGGGGGPRPPYPDRKLAINDTEIKLEHERTMDMRWRVTTGIVAALNLVLLIVVSVWFKEESDLKKMFSYIFFLTTLALCGINIKSGAKAIAEAIWGKKD